MNLQANGPELPTAEASPACPCCGGLGMAAPAGGPCDACCREFRNRLQVTGRSTQELSRRMARETWMLGGFLLGMASVVVAASVAAYYYRGNAPWQIDFGMRAFQVACMAYGIAVCLRADASARGVPRPPLRSILSGRRFLESIEDLVPGAVPCVVALLLPWAIGAHGRSLLLATANLALATATAASAAIIMHRTRALARMRDACQASGLVRSAVWRRSNPRRAAALAVLAWTMLIVAACAVTPAGAAGMSSTLDRAAAAALALGGVLWLIAFRDARRECGRLSDWLDARGT